MLFHILVMISLFISYLKTNGEKVIIEPHLVPEVILKELVDTSEEKQKHWSIDTNSKSLSFNIEGNLRVLEVDDKYVIDSESYWLVCYAFKLVQEN